ncbi:MAG TPA: hypothetical protein VMW48_07625 [Vicinamibacterales bacterium]|nr:hypothetical protein [Vicinamibacterales bacterium]
MTARVALVLIAAQLTALARPPAALAQDVPVVFVHGIFASGQSWQTTADRLAATMQIQPHVVELPSTSRFETQVAALDGQMHGLPASTIAIGHSQGGLVARDWSRSRPLNGILTLGTPHGGSQLAARGLDLINFNLLTYNVAGLVGTYDAGGEFAWVIAAIAGHLAQTQLLSWAVASSIASSVAVASLVPVAPQLVPGSAFLGTLNSGANLARESAAIAKRVGLVYTAHDYWRAGAAVALAPDNREWAWSVMQVMPPVFDYVAAYLDVNYSATNLVARSLAARLRDLAGLTRNMDPMWCWAVTGDSLCRIPHDGVVAVPDQVYPNAVNFAVSGPAHTQEEQRSEGEIRTVLTGVMGVPSRGAPPPPPPPGGPGPSSLTGGQRLYADQEVRSANGDATLRYQGDGNLVLYGTGGAVLWASDTAGASAGRAEMQTDGNFVIYDAGDVPVWAAESNAAGGYLTVRDEGFLMLYNAGHVGIWWTGSGTP